VKIIYSNTIFFYQKSGGISRYFTNLAEQLSKCKVHPLIIAPLSKNLYLKNFKKKKISFYLKRFPNWKIFEKINYFFFKYISIKYRPDIIHETYFNKVNFSFFDDKIKILTIYDLIHEKFKKMYSNQNVPNKLDIIDYVDHFICISKKTQKDFIKYYKVSQKKTSVVYLGSDHLKKNFKYFKKNRPISEKYILFVGSRDRYKDFKILVKSINSSEKLKNYKVICFGGGRFTDKEINKYKIGENFIYIDGDDLLLRNLYVFAEVFINTSSYEGFGITNLEAMSLGCPVITSDFEVFREVGGNSCLYFKTKNHLDLKKQIVKVLFNTKIRKKLIINGYKRSKKFTWENCAKQTLSIYNTLLK